MKRFTLGIMMAFAVAACAVGPEDQAEYLDLEVDTGVLAGPTSGTAESSPDSIALSVYLVRDNRLVHVTRELASPSLSLVDAVITDAIAGPTPAEARSGIWSAIPPGTSVLGSRVVNGVAEIDLTSDFAVIGGTDEILAVAQIVWSVTALSDVDAVVFLLDGSPTGAPRADGVLVSGPLRGDDYRELAGQ